MSHDPFQEREAEKYANPIPSREFIIEHLTKREKPANREELAVELNIEGEEQIEALRRRLRAMERDGQLVFTRRQCYALPERLDLLKGTVIGHRDGFGFLRVEGRKDDLYLSSEQMKMCIHGDQILAQPLGADRKGRREARVVRVLVPKTSQIVGRYFTDAGVGFVVPDDSRLSFDILIPPEEVMGARMGFVVVVELTQRPTRRTKAVGKIVEVLGDNMGTGMAVDMALRTHEIPYIWPKAVEEQIESLREEVPEESSPDNGLRSLTDKGSMEISCLSYGSHMVPVRLLPFSDFLSESAFPLHASSLHIIRAALRISFRGASAQRLQCARRCRTAHRGHGRGTYCRSRDSGARAPAP